VIHPHKWLPAECNLGNALELSSPRIPILTSDPRWADVRVRQDPRFGARPMLNSTTLHAISFSIRRALQSKCFVSCVGPDVGKEKEEP